MSVAGFWIRLCRCLNIFCISLLLIPGMPLYGRAVQEGKTVPKTGGRSNVLPLDFDLSFSTAVENSFELRAIRARERVYDLAIGESMREYFPSLTLSYAETEEARRRETDDRMSRLSLESEMTLYDGGTRRLNLRSSRLNALLARNDYRIAFNRLFVSVREQYLNLIRLSETVKIYRKTHERGLLQLRFIKKEHELGDSTRLDVMEIESRVRELELSVKKAADEYESALNSFKLLLGIDWKREVALKGSMEDEFRPVSVQNLNRERMVALAVKYRKEIESSAAEYEISRNRYRINRNYYIPNVSVGFSYSLSDEEFPPREKGWGVSMKFTSRFFGSTLSGNRGYSESGNGNSRARSGNASLGLFDDLAYRRNIAESRINTASALDAVKKTRQKVALEVLTACSSFINAREMIEIAGKNLKLYDSQLKIERLKAEMGEVRRYDLLEKEIERSRAAVEFLNARISCLSALSVLETATGTGMDFSGIIRGGGDGN